MDSFGDSFFPTYAPELDVPEPYPLQDPWQGADEINAQPMLMPAYHQDMAPQQPFISPIHVPMDNHQATEDYLVAAEQYPATWNQPVVENHWAIEPNQLADYQLVADTYSRYRCNPLPIPT